MVEHLTFNQVVRGSNPRTLIVVRDMILESVAKTLNGQHMPKPYEVYKHFKGNLYVVLNVARHTETNFRLLVSWKAYKDLNLEDRLWYVQNMHFEKIK